MTGVAMGKGGAIAKIAKIKLRRHEVYVHIFGVGQCLDQAGSRIFCMHSIPAKASARLQETIK